MPAFEAALVNQRWLAQKLGGAAVGAGDLAAEGAESDSDTTPMAAMALGRMVSLWVLSRAARTSGSIVAGVPSLRNILAGGEPQALAGVLEIAVEEGHRIEQVFFAASHSASLARKRTNLIFFKLFVGSPAQSPQGLGITGKALEDNMAQAADDLEADRYIAFGREGLLQRRTLGIARATQGDGRLAADADLGAVEFAAEAVDIWVLRRDQGGQ